VCFSQGGERVGKRNVLGEVLLGEGVEMESVVRLCNLRAIPELASKETLAERRVGQDRNAVLARRVEHAVVLDLGQERRVFKLDRRDLCAELFGCFRGLVDGLCAKFGEGGVLEESFLLESGEILDDLFDGQARVAAAWLVEVELGTFLVRAQRGADVDDVSAEVLQLGGGTRASDALLEVVHHDDASFDIKHHGLLEVRVLLEEATEESKVGVRLVSLVVEGTAVEEDGRRGHCWLRWPS